MKNLLLPFLLIILYSNFGTSQLLLNLKEIQTGSGGQKTMIVTALNEPAGGRMFHRYLGNNSNTEIHSGDTVFIPSMSDEHSILYILSSDTLITAEIFHSGSYQIVEYNPPSNQLSSDGYLKIHFDSIQNQKPHCAKLGIGGSSLFVDSIDQQTFQIPNLPYGCIEISHDFILNDTTEYYAFHYEQDIYLFAGDMSLLLLDNSLVFNNNTIDSDSSCNGSIELFPTNAIGNVIYTWSNDSTNTSSSAQNLCPGSYSIHAIDDAMQEGLITLYVVDSSDVYIDSSIYVYTPEDSAYYFWENCSIDFNLPIDSIFYSDTTLSLPTSDTLVLYYEFLIYQDTNAYLFADTLLINSLDSTVYLDIVIYCQLQKELFSAKRIKYIRHGISEEAKLNELDLVQQIQLFPNPTENNIYIKGYSGEVFLTDLNGKVIYRSQENYLSLRELENGIYLLRLADSTKTFKIIKN